MKHPQSVLLLVLVLLGCYLPVQAQSPTPRDPRECVHIDFAMFKQNLNVFRQFNGRLPTDKEGLDTLVHCPASMKGTTWHQLLKSLPLDPWGHWYHYRLAPDQPQGYDLFSLGLDGTESADDIHIQ